MKYRNTYQILFIVILFSVTETTHYGWNLSPKTDAEMVCDGLVSIMICLACICASIERR